MYDEHQVIIYFAHGKESGPRGSKIQRLAAIARRHGCAVESVDYRETLDPDERVAKLCALRPTSPGKLVLVGSSMGAYVSTVASATLQPDGLFLLAPAFYLPGYRDSDPTPHCPHTEVVHGWNDSVVPVEHALRFARRHQLAALHILPGDHRLIDVLPAVETLFEGFLAHVLAGPRTDGRPDTAHTAGLPGSPSTS